MLKLLIIQHQLEVYQKNYILLNLKNTCQKQFFHREVLDIINFIKKNKLSVMKPINGHSGNNILLLKGKD